MSKSISLFMRYIKYSLILIASINCLIFGSILRVLMFLCYVCQLGLGIWRKGTVEIRPQEAFFRTIIIPVIAMSRMLVAFIAWWRKNWQIFLFSVLAFFFLFACSTGPGQCQNLPRFACFADRK